MMGIKGKAGKWNICWKSVPRGQSGSAEVEIDDGGKVRHSYKVHWRKDADGIWVELPHGLFGYDLQAERDDDGRVRFEVSRRGAAEHWVKQAFIRAGEEAVANAAPGRKAARVRAQMPGKIIRILVPEGTVVEKDQPIILMEAMKMENEIRAPQMGRVDHLKVTEGQAVETGADLCMIEPIE